MRTHWPKNIFMLTPSERNILEQIYQDMQKWGYTGFLGWIQNLGHKAIEWLSIKRTGGKQVYRTLELGCGSGWHFQFSDTRNYFGIDLRATLLEEARIANQNVHLAQADIYRLPFCDASFDRIISIYVFEHLHRLPECYAEIYRVLKQHGELLVCLPSEGGLAYDLGRKLTTKRHFEKKYGVDYMRIIRHEHCNTFREVMEELSEWFHVERVWFLPFLIPNIHVSAIVAIRCKKKNSR